MNEYLLFLSKQNYIK